jgi:hypothetical protein
MRKVIFYTLLLFSFLNTSFAQDVSFKPADLVQNANAFKKATKVSIFSKNENRSATVPAELTNFELIEIDEQKVKEIASSQIDFFEISVPVYGRADLKLQLVEVNIHSSDTYVTTKPSNEVVKVNPGKHFRGIVKGNEKSVVALSIFDNEVMGFISEPGQSNLVIGMLEDKTSHIIYEDNDLLDKFGFDCATPESNVEYTAEELSDVDGGSRALTDCVRIYLEVDNDIYIDKGSNTTTVTNFITGLFNQVATMYANEQINVVLSPLVIWTAPSPYNSTSSSGMLNAFLANTGAFDGDLAQLLSYKASGGIAYVDQLCASNPDLSKSFSSIDPTYQNVPVYSWSVMVITHEFGHLFGSSHTHACAWNGNNTAIDGCYTTEGSCPQPGIPSGGGTVMSYCHLTSAGINLNLGFGPQPGNLIRSRVTNASCTQPCSGDGPTCTDGVQNGNETGVDCGGPDCPACPVGCDDTEADLTIVLDNYPGETTWTLKNASGTTLYSGGPYSGAGSTVSETFCLVDGCYDFQINDSYGDGICCGYGQGSYDITVNGQSEASGGAFGSSELTNFCVGGGAGPTCTDGVQNGNETGVDCGGPDCPACPSCTDGVQNGNETGVDCGGPDCPACPTCNDGIQNGNETGVDCGGPDCPACPVGCDDTEADLTIVLDNYPGETTWTLKNASGTTLYSGGPYSGAGSTVSETFCLVDGCYDFQINDSYGDGICCGYGQGSYDITVNGQSEASGGAFGSSELTNFCVGGGAGPTCTDGVQNGNETGVDCGGPDCPACPSCTDGVQNGNETGVDCGGPDCPACPTCNDGIQNGNETGVDCGGPDCSPCGGGNDELFAHYFETGWDGWQDGGSDCYRYSGSRSWEGSYSIRIRDNSGTGSAMTSQSYNLTSYSGVEVTFFFYPNSMENGEDFWLRYYDGSSWQTVATFVSGTSFQNNTFYTATVPILSSQYNMASNAQFRFQCDASGNADRIYIDQVSAVGLASGSLPSGEIKITPLHSLAGTEQFSFVEEMQISPNPALDEIRVRLNLDHSQNVSISVVDILGRSILNTNSNVSEGMNAIPIDISSLDSGTYFLKVIDAEGDEMVDKFIKLK